uniref:BRCT domain-containing protein n=1 Tax=Panagrolaimus superbus TaxID=310955 RepID=A0A914Z212_9BILA
MKNNRTKTAVMTESEESDDEFSILNCSTKKDRKNNSFKKATQKKSSKIKVKKEVDEGCKKVDRAAVPAVSNEHRTPKCQPLNSKALIEKRQIKRHQRNIFEGCEAEKKEEGEDPFNFDSKKDELPIFFESVNNNNKQRPCYNDIKSFINTPNITVKMGDEKQKLVSASSKKSSLSETPKISSNITETPAKLAKVETNNVQTSVKKPLPKIEEEIPVLNAEEQVVADDESNTFYPKGARVFAFYNKAYYPAIIDEFDGLGRYKIFFTEDNSKRTVPRDGIFPLHFVKEDMQVTVLGEYDEENRRIVYDGKIVAIPSLKNIEEWHRGLYKIEVTNNDHPEPESREIEWIDIFFDEVQYKRSKKNFTTNNQENNIGSRRRTRPSTALVASTATPKLPVTIPMPTSSSDIEKNGNDVKAEDTSREPKENSEVSSSSGGSKSPFKIFDKLQFILTSANRESGPRPFAKREVRKQIESRGGNVVETFESMNPDLTTYLIADTFYRTHKYLTALSLSVPTVSFKWINKCVEEVSE